MAGRVGRGGNGRSEHDIRGRTFPGRSAHAGDARGLGRDIWEVFEGNADRLDKQEEIHGFLWFLKTPKRRQVQGLESLLGS